MPEYWNNIRIQHLHGTEDEWNNIEDTFIPEAGELIIYDANNTQSPTMKVGDGQSKLRDLLPLGNERTLNTTVNIDSFYSRKNVSLTVGSPTDSWDNYVYVVPTASSEISLPRLHGKLDFNTTITQQHSELIPGTYDISLDYITTSHLKASSFRKNKTKSIEIENILPKGTWDLGNNLPFQLPTIQDTINSYECCWTVNVIWGVYDAVGTRTSGEQENTLLMLQSDGTGGWKLTASHTPKFSGGSYPMHTGYEETATYNWSKSRWEYTTEGYNEAMDSYQLPESIFTPNDDINTYREGEYNNWGDGVVNVDSSRLLSYLSPYLSAKDNTMSGTWCPENIIAFDELLSGLYSNVMGTSFSMALGSYGASGSLTLYSNHEVRLSMGSSNVVTYTGGAWSSNLRKFSILPSDKISLYHYKWINTNCKKLS